MPKSFTDERWLEIKGNYDKWWEHDLDLPLISASVWKEPDLKKPFLHQMTQTEFADLTISPEKIAERIEYEVSSRDYIADGYPLYSFAFSGPGIVAAFLGSNIGINNNWIWFHPPDKLPAIDKLHFEYNEDNIWFRRLVDIYESTIKRTEGKVVLGLPDLGGILDIISTFFPGEKLIFEVCDNPSEVKRLISEIEDIWTQYHNKFIDILKGRIPGYSDWSLVYSDKPLYIVQSDFSYMISPQMFKELVLPTIINNAVKIPRTIYHLDGVGQLPHLSMICNIERLDAIQWVPGTGKPDFWEWPDVYEKILNSGKNTWIYANRNDLMQMKKVLGNLKGFFITYILSQGETKDDIFRTIEKIKV